MGTIFGRSKKAYDSWSRKTRRLPPSLKGQALEAAVMRIATMFPENVIRGVGA